MKAVHEDFMNILHRTDPLENFNGLDIVHFPITEYYKRIPLHHSNLTTITPYSYIQCCETAKKQVPVNTHERENRKI